MSCNKIKKRVKSIVIFGLLLGISIFFIIPCVRTHSIVGADDLPYHIYRIEELVNNIKHGNIYPYFYTYKFSKIGFPLGIFYPQITLIPIAFLVIMTGNYLIGIYLGIFFYTFLAVLFTYIVARKFKYTRIQSIFSAILYCFCTYRTIDAFTRFAFGEFVAMTFLPLVVYGLYAIMYGNYKDWPFLTLGFSGILFSHYLSTVICGLIVGLLFVLGFYWIKNKKERIKSWILVGISFIGQVLIILVPFLIQEHFQKYQTPTPIPLETYAHPLSELINVSINNNMSRDGFFSIGVVLLFIVVWGLIKFNQLNKINRVFLIVGTVLFLICSNLFVWKFFNKTPLKVIQFPFRFLGISSIVLSLIGGSLIGSLFNKYNKISLSKVLLFIGLNLLIIIPWYCSVQNDIIAKAAEKITAESISDVKSLEYLDQFTPASSLSELDNIKNHIASVDNKNISLKDNEIKSIPDGLVYTNKKLQNAENVILPEAIYKGLKVTQNGKELKYKKGKGNRILLTNTKSGNIEVKFEKSPIIIGSQWISVITTLLVLGLFIRRIRKE